MHTTPIRSSCPASPPGVAPCEHGWVTESAHQTSEGVIRYTRCVRCGARRVELLEPHALAPRAVSRVVHAHAAARVGRIPGSVRGRY